MANRQNTPPRNGMQSITQKEQAHPGSRQWYAEYHTKGTSTPRRGADIQHATTGAPNTETRPVRSAPLFSSGTQEMKCGC